MMPQQCRRLSCLALVLCSIVLVMPTAALAHVKWFVEFDVSDPPRSLWTLAQVAYLPALLLLSLWGVLIAGWVDSLWGRQWGTFTFFSRSVPNVDETALNIMRIGTGVACVIMWLMGGVILAPELYSDAPFIAYLHLLITAAVMFRSTLAIAGIGIVVLYGYAVFVYGIFHLLDYVLVLGQAAFLMLSAAPLQRRWGKWRFPVLYLGVIFSFLWSAIEKLAYPQWFYPLLEEHSFLAMGLDWDFFILTAAFVEFTLFFLLLVSHNGAILLALLINVLITSGNIYFGKTDAVGHFPANFMLLVMLLKGPLPVQTALFNQSCKGVWESVGNVMVYMVVLVAMVALYYGVHFVAYSLPANFLL